MAKKPKQKPLSRAKNSSKVAKRADRPEKKGGLSAWFQHHQAVAVESLERLFSEAGSSILTWAVIGIALALPLCLLLLLQNLQQFGSKIDDAAQISLYMDMRLTEVELQELAVDLQTKPEVESVRLILASQALEEFQLNSGFGNVLNGIDENPLPSVLEVNPQGDDPAQIERLFSQLEAIEEVDQAQLDIQWIQRLYGLLSLAQRMTQVLTGLLCVGVILVVGNTVRLAIENRRAEIVVVKLVGGTDAYVARPFLYTGLWFGVGGGIIACILVLLAQFGIKGSVSNIAGLYESSFSMLGLDVSDILLILSGSGLLGWLGAWLSVLRHLKSIEPK